MPNRSMEADMAAMAVILGGVVGFVSALVSLIVFNASWLTALGLWSLGGAALALILIARAAAPRRAPAPALGAKHA